jgi:hypothetical protein
MFNNSFVEVQQLPFFFLVQVHIPYPPLHSNHLLLLLHSTAEAADEELLLLDEHYEHA